LHTGTGKEEVEQDGGAGVLNIAMGGEGEHAKRPVIESSGNATAFPICETVQEKIPVRDTGITKAGDEGTAGGEKEEKMNSCSDQSGAGRGGKVGVACKLREKA